MSRWKTLREKKKGPSPQQVALQEKREAELKQLCTCGHLRGDHYIHTEWPACAECTSCRGFQAMNYEEIYEKEHWEGLQDTRIRLVDPAEGAGEGIWAKQLPNGLVALNNHPLCEAYRWQDILDGQHNVLHRRWHTRVRYRFTPLEGAEASLGRKKELFEVLKELGNPNFFMPGMAYVLMEDKDAAKCREQVVEALAGLDYVLDVEPLEVILGLGEATAEA